MVEAGGGHAVQRKAPACLCTVDAAALNPKP